MFASTPHTVKVKCDKVAPICGRCTRLGSPCHSQARGRGRPFKQVHSLGRTFWNFGLEKQPFTETHVDAGA